MTMHDDPDLRLLERDLKQLAEPRGEDERVRLAVRTELVARLRPRPLARRRRRRSLRVAVAASAVTAAAAAALLLTVIGTSGSGGPAVADAAIIHHALSAMTPHAGEILHTKMVSTQNGVTLEAEVWRQTAPPYAGRGIKGPLGHLAEFSNDGTTSFDYDPTTNTIYKRSDSPPPPSSDPVSQARHELANGHAQVDGTVVIDRVSLYRIDLPNGLVGYFDTKSYAARYLDDPQRDGSVVRLRVVAYEYLPMTPSNRNLLSVTAQHPGARVESGSVPGTGQ